MTLKYQMINSDFDSTLTNSRGEITARTRIAVQNYIAQGGIFLVNTGRSYLSLIPRMKEVYGENCSYPTACLQGCMIYTTDGGLVYNVVMDKSEVIRLAKKIESLGQYFQIYSGSRLFAASPCEWSEGYANATGTQQEFVGRLSKFLETYERGVDKILLISDVQTVAEKYKIFTNDNSYKNTKFVYSTSYFLEAIPVAAGKDVALRRFADMYGVDISRTAAVGDSNNDIPMVKEAGLGVAVGNAVDELKAVADIVIGDTDDDGLARFLETTALEKMT